MLNLELLRSDPEGVKAGLLKRMDSVDLGPILEADQSRRSLAMRVEKARSELKKQSKEIGTLRASGVDTAAQQEATAGLADEITQLQAELNQVEQTLQQLMMELPNIPDAQVPVGGKEMNEVVHTWGEAPELGPDALDHVELCTRLGLVDFPRGVKLGGSGHWLYRGQGAALEWALLDYFSREHYQAGYEFMLPPHLLTEESGFAAGQFPKFYDDVFHLVPDGGGRGSFLLPTSETAILNTYRDEIIPDSSLPMKVFAYTPCYRKESGGYRTEERGTIRGHQFNKVEMFQFVAPEDADAAFEEMLRRTESLVENLGLHYRTSRLASRDVSATMRKTFDVEIWIPSLGTYKEVSSVSWAGDYQARRANIRYRPQGAKGTALVHTLNASGLATSRLLPAIVEQNQQPDGSIVVPKPLRHWLGTDVIRPKG
ncbi:serine--tRNA ligase [Streptomyces sp. NPDC059456]|uniref:serine--tRNA ligase n=1 Tax=Streptomyces sp. NPDC059456 TaxID=3346838 RepID=UPI0036BFB164